MNQDTCTFSSKHNFLLSPQGMICFLSKFNYSMPDKMSHLLDHIYSQFLGKQKLILRTGQLIDIISLQNNFIK